MFGRIHRWVLPQDFGKDRLDFRGNLITAILSGIVFLATQFGFSLVWFFLIPLAGTTLAGRRNGLIWTLLSLGVLGVSSFNETFFAFAPVLLACAAFASFAEKRRVTENRKLRISREQLRLQHSVVDTTVSDLRLMQRKLVDSQKMVALGEMSGGIAHEINTPLAAIQLYAEMSSGLLSEEKINREELLQNAEKIMQTTDRIKNIIIGLRSFSRNGGEDPFAKITLKQIVDGTLALCHERFRETDVRLIVGEIPDLKILARGVQISQVLLNLLNNSLDAISANQEKWVKVQFFDHNEDVRIIVSDSGSGIPVEVRTKIFQPFYTTKELGKGTGLGLSISKGLIEAHQGTLTYHDSAPNTTFVICLPKAA